MQTKKNHININLKIAIEKKAKKNLKKKIEKEEQIIQSTLNDANKFAFRIFDQILFCFVAF